MANQGISSWTAAEVAEWSHHYLREHAIYLEHCDGMAVADVMNVLPQTCAPLEVIAKIQMRYKIDCSKSFEQVRHEISQCEAREEIQTKNKIWQDFVLNGVASKPPLKLFPRLPQTEPAFDDNECNFHAATEKACDRLNLWYHAMLEQSKNDEGHPAGESFLEDMIANMCNWAQTSQFFRQYIINSSAIDGVFCNADTVDMTNFKSDGEFIEFKIGTSPDIALAQLACYVERSLPKEGPQKVRGHILISSPIIVSAVPPISHYVVEISLKKNELPEVHVESAKTFSIIWDQKANPKAVSAWLNTAGWLKRENLAALHSRDDTLED